MQNRREFIKGSTVFAAMMAAAPTVLRAQGAKKVFKVGMIGAGGRTCGAFDDLRKAAQGMGHDTELVAVCDFFEHKAKGASKRFSEEKAKAFWGANGYKDVVAIPEIEIIVTASPPAFRPPQVRAAIEAGKHVFAEKPVAVDGPGIRHFLETAKLAKEKNLSLVAGTQRRHQKGYLLQALALQQGKLGKIVSGNVYWNGTVPFIRRRGEKNNAAYLTDNWVNWTEMNGDHIVEQHVHNIDVANWFLGRPPRTANGFGGRARRKTGNQYDFFSIDFDYGDGVHIHSQCRQIDGTSGNVSEHFLTNTDIEISGGGKVWKVGEKDGIALAGDVYVNNGNTFRIKDGNPYMLEHENLLRGFLKEVPILNEGETVAMSTLSAIMGRISCYTGQVVRMSDLLENKESQFFNMECKPSWQDFEAAAANNGDVAMPEYGDDQWPLPGKPCTR